MTANNLVGNCTEVETDDDNQVGKVIQTTPQAGTSADKNSTVNIQIGKKASRRPRSRASSARRWDRPSRSSNAAGFTNIQFANGSDQSDTALVSQQDPRPNSEVDDPAGTQITLTTVGVGNNGGNNGGNNNGGIFGGATGTAARTED